MLVALSVLPCRLLSLELVVALGHVYLGAMLAHRGCCPLAMSRSAPRLDGLVARFKLRKQALDVGMTRPSEAPCLCIVLVIFGGFPLVRVRLVCYPRFDKASMFPK